MRKPPLPAEWGRGGVCLTRDDDERTNEDAPGQGLWGYRLAASRALTAAVPMAPAVATGSSSPLMISTPL